MKRYFYLILSDESTLDWRFSRLLRGGERTWHQWRHQASLSPLSRLWLNLYKEMFVSGDERFRISTAQHNLSLSVKTQISYELFCMFLWTNWNKYLIWCQVLIYFQITRIDVDLIIQIILAMYQVTAQNSSAHTEDLMRGVSYTGLDRPVTRNYV